MREGIKYNNKSQAETLALRLTNKVKGDLTGNTTDYVKPIQNPITSEWAVEVIRKGKYWDKIYTELNPNDINNIIELDSTWNINHNI